MPEPAFEPMPQKDYQTTPSPDAGALLFNGLIKLQGELSEIEKELKNTTDDEKIIILEIKRDAPIKQIKNYGESLDGRRKMEKNNDLIKTAGENNVIEIKNFKNRQGGDKYNDQVGDDFLNSLKEFKKEELPSLFFVGAN